MYHVFADVAERAAGRVRGAASDQPLRAQALAIEDDAGLTVLVAGLSPDATSVVLEGLPDGEGRLRLLDVGTAVEAMGDPSAFRASGGAVRIEGGRVTIDLPGYAVARLDMPAGR
jgi:hypothetical protein